MNRTRCTMMKYSKIIILFILIGGLFYASANVRPAASKDEFQSIIVQGLSVDQAAGAVEQFGGVVTSRLEIISGVGAQVPASAIASLKNAPGITGVSENASTHLTSVSYEKTTQNTPGSDYPDAIGADLLWAEQNTGKGVTVAILDTGIATHPSLSTSTKGKSRNLVVAWADFVDGKKTPFDPNGHGTHIAGIISNSSQSQD